ncbi:MAG: hypothetical protein ACKVWR_14935 [Acidimicrobiales bacterium]
MEPERALVWLGHLVLPGLLDGEHSFALQPTAAGADITHAETFRGLLVKPMRRSIVEQTTAGMNAMNGALKARAEHP